jgi:hypothetical protein
VSAVLALVGIATLDADSTTPRASRVWGCDSDWDLEWCAQFNVHNISNAGGGASTRAFAENLCEGATVGAASWVSGPTVEDDGYDEDETTGYAESSTNATPPDDSSFHGVYTLHDEHWYMGDPFTCGSGELPSFNNTWDIS